MTVLSACQRHALWVDGPQYRPVQYALRAVVKWQLPVASLLQIVPGVKPPVEADFIQAAEPDERVDNARQPGHIAEQEGNQVKPEEPD